MKDVEPALPIASPLMRFLFGLNNPISWSCDASGWFNTAQSPNLQQKKKKEKEKRKRKELWQVTGETGFNSIKRASSGLIIRRKEIPRMPSSMRRHELLQRARALDGVAVASPLIPVPLKIFIRFFLLFFSSSSTSSSSSSSSSSLLLNYYFVLSPMK